MCDPAAECARESKAGIEIKTRGCLQGTLLKSRGRHDWNWFQECEAGRVWRVESGE